MPKQLRIAVAGLGRIGWHFHCGQIAKHHSFKLAAVADPVAERLDEAKAKFRCQPYADFYDMIASETLDAVVIATPTHLHREMALAAFGEGLHMVMEKPLATNAAEAESIVRAAARRKRLLTVYQPHRLLAYFQHLRQVLATNRIGRIFQVRRDHWGYSRRDDWQGLQKYGGGMLNNYGAHGLDQILQLTGYDIKRVFGDLQRVATLGDADDVVRLLYETRRGVIGELHISMASCISRFELGVWGSHGTIICERNQMRVRSFDPAKLAQKKLDPRLASPNRQYPQDQIEFEEEVIDVDPSLEINLYTNLAQAIRKGTPLEVLPRQPLAVMRLIDRCRESSGAVADFR